MSDIGAASYHDDVPRRSFERAAPYTNKGVIVDKYVRHNQDWIVPRRVMCAFFWTGIILLFTGIILLVTSKHKDGGYQSWGGVLLGLGFCLLLICLILCMHAYCVITVADDEPPRVLTVPPPPPALLTLANGHKPLPPDGAMDAGYHDNVSSVSYGSIQFNERPSSGNTLKSLPDDVDQEQCSCRGIRYPSNQSTMVKGAQKEEGGTTKELAASEDASRDGKRTLESVGRLPSYSTAIKMPPYSPSRKRAYSYEAEVDIGHLKEDGTTRRHPLKKTVTFDDSTGDLRMEFDPSLEDEDSQQNINVRSALLGSPPYDNEIELHGLEASSPASFHLYKDTSLSTIPESPSSISDVSSNCAVTNTTWSHVTPKTHVPSLVNAVSSSPLSKHTDSDVTMSTDTHMVFSTPSLPSPATSDTRGKSNEKLMQQSPRNKRKISETLPTTRDRNTFQAPATVHSERFITTHPDVYSTTPRKDRIDKTAPRQMPVNGISSQPSTSSNGSLALEQEPPGTIKNAGKASPKPLKATSPVAFNRDRTVRPKEPKIPTIPQLPVVVAHGGDSPFTRKVAGQSAGKQLSVDVESTGSSKISVYDNVQYVWTPKSGSELKHYHF